MRRWECFVNCMCYVLGGGDRKSCAAGGTTAAPSTQGSALAWFLEAEVFVFCCLSSPGT